MNIQNLSDSLQSHRPLWVFCDAKKGLMFGIGLYDHHKTLCLIEKLTWDQAMLLERKTKFGNSASDFVKEWTIAKAKRSNIFDIKEKYGMVHERDFAKLPTTTIGAIHD